MANPLLGLAEGGNFTAVGIMIGKHTRLAVTALDTVAAADALTGTTSLSQTLLGNSAMQPVATGFGAGITTRLDDGWRGGLTVDVLHERNALLGTTYDTSGALGLGGHHASVSLGLSTSLDLGEDAGVLFDASIARSDGASVADGLVTGVSSTLSRAYGVAFVEQNAFASGDHLSIGLRRPLTVIGGSATIATTSIDSQGFATTGTTRVSLTPQTSETDLVVSYGIPLQFGINLTADLTLRRDYDNVPGNNDALAMLGMHLKF
jgi:hypothetical protein